VNVQSGLPPDPPVEEIISRPDRRYPSTWVLLIHSVGPSSGVVWAVVWAVYSQQSSNRAVWFGHAVDVDTARREAHIAVPPFLVPGPAPGSAQKRAGSVRTSPRRLDRLLVYLDPSLLYGVARNPRTASSTLRKLGARQDCMVRQAVGCHPSTPQDVLDQFASDRDPDVRTAVASNPSCLPTMLCRFLDDEDDEVVKAAGSNPNMTPGLFAMWQLAH